MTPAKPSGRGEKQGGQNVDDEERDQVEVRPIRVAEATIDCDEDEATDEEEREAGECAYCGEAATRVVTNKITHAMWFICNDQVCFDQGEPA